MDQVLEGRTYYRDREGNEITQEEYERLQCGEDRQPDESTKDEGGNGQ